MKELKKEFFKEDTLKVAKNIIGKLLCVDNKCARIIEVEAYKEDKASHARTKTKRSAIMHETYGHIYVYFIYGMYYCLNITTDEKPGAILIRALALDGCEGPGKLCKTLNITMQDNAQEIGSRIKIFDDYYNPKIKRTARIGIKQDMLLKWRFIDANYLTK